MVNGYNGLLARSIILQNLCEHVMIQECAR